MNTYDSLNQESIHTHTHIHTHTGTIITDIPITLLTVTYNTQHTLDIFDSTHFYEISITADKSFNYRNFQIIRMSSTYVSDYVGTTLKEKLINKKQQINRTDSNKANTESE